MTLSQIECFLLVVDKMSFTEAARVLYVSQPAISRWISLLEEELGFELFYRNNSKLFLTDAGARLSHLFRNFLNEYNQTISDLNAGTLEVTGTVRIGCADGWDISPFVNDAKKLLHELYPDIHLAVSFSDHEELVRQLANKEIDLVIEQQDLFMTVQDITVTPLHSASCILMFAADHPLAGEAELNLYSFRNSVFYIRSSENMQGISRNVIDACIFSGFRPKIEYVDSLSAAYAKMLSDDGVFFADEYILAAHNDLFRFITLPFKRTIALISSNDKNSACSIAENTIISCCRDLFGQPELTI